jgi:hypothetical protein
MLKDAEYFIAQPDEFAALTEDQQNTFYERGVFDDEIPQDVEDSAPSDAETDNDSKEVKEATEAVSDSSDEDDEPVILGKGGKHTIPYAELENARSETQQWRQQAEQQAELIKQLEAAQLQDKGTGDTKALDAVIEEYAGEFPEVAEDLKPYIQKMVDSGVQAALKTQLEQRVMPLEQRLQEQMQKEHNAAIWSVHPDISERLDEPAFNAFATTNPWLLDAKTKAPLNIAEVLQQGTAAQVNEVLSQYKAAQQPEVKTEPEPAPAKSDLTGKAKATISNVKPKSPGTFSDIPAAILGKHDEAERILSMTDSELERTFLTMSESERNKLFERLV